MEIKDNFVSAVAPRDRRQQKKLEVYGEILRRLEETYHPETQDPSFAGQLLEHFNRLPSRYFKEINVERAENVLLHKRMLDQARDPLNRLVLEVRLVTCSPLISSLPLHEINFSRNDKLKLLLPESSLLEELGLNIKEVLDPTPAQQ